MNNKPNTEDLSDDLLCPHFSKCSGCEISKNLKTPPIFEEAKKYFASKGFNDLTLISGNLHFWRYRAKLSVRGTSENPKIGLYEKNTHNIVDIPFCKVHHPQINEIVELVKSFIKKEKIEPYNEITGKGELRYLQLVVERRTGLVQLTFVLNSDTVQDLKKWELDDKRLHSIWLNHNKTRTNNIFGPHWTHIKGPLLVLEEFHGVEVCFHPASFAQANLDLFEKMLSSINKNILKNKHVVEYYSGVGVIGLAVLKHCKSVVCCEITPQAKDCFDVSKEKLDPEIAKKITFEVGLSEKRSDLLKEKNIAIVDPPRKGVDSSFLKDVIEAPLDQLIYISCGWKAFQRDCDMILADSRWRLEKIENYLFFPGSNHLEILAYFSKTSVKL